MNPLIYLAIVAYAIVFFWWNRKRNSKRDERELHLLLKEHSLLLHAYAVTLLGCVMYCLAYPETTGFAVIRIFVISMALVQSAYAIYQRRSLTRFDD